MGHGTLQKSTDTEMGKDYFSQVYLRLTFLHVFFEKDTPIKKVGK